MILHLFLDGEKYVIDPGNGADLSIPLDFSGPQPNAFSLPKAGARLLGFKTCRCSTLTLTPHGNGTHTESAGHLSRRRLPLSSIVIPALIPATVVSVTPESRNGHEIIGQAILARALRSARQPFMEGLVVRTLPNAPGKKAKAYGRANAPYFAPDAIACLNRMGVKHLLTDLPSLDKEDDPRLSAHRVFWNLPRKSSAPDEKHRNKTVTEMIYVENKIRDSEYFLSLQIPRFVQEAAPSRPILYPARKSGRR